jgi:hypothetical protein
MLHRTRLVRFMLGPSTFYQALFECWVANLQVKILLLFWVNRTHYRWIALTQFGKRWRFLECKRLLNQLLVSFSHQGLLLRTLRRYKQWGPRSLSKLGGTLLRLKQLFFEILWFICRLVIIDSSLLSFLSFCWWIVDDQSFICLVDYLGFDTATLSCSTTTLCGYGGCWFLVE